MSDVRPDFELYADQKPFNYSIAPTWRAVFEGLFARLGKAPSDIRFLDVGCGDGKLFPYLMEAGLDPERTDGVEVSHKRIDRCHAIGWTRAKYMEPGQQLPYEDDAFDIINLLEVVEHVPEDTIASLLSELRRVVKPAGYVLLTTPNYPIKRFYDIYNAVAHGKWARLKDDPTHVTFYNHKRLADLLGGYFERIEEHPFKDGFIYKRLPRPFFRHKIFYVCSQPK